ncbi:hypothetical protein POM88_011016 [Heracleum sosnowskyi]|uniref:Uncharacterized protein n=1 Tax=Heracleum sosnowskyi TaxID=360622 RepID=A0AAD8IXL5_9APIA|nr:hypothetical protein POM88_011016 [Heracleum sosnowskyi]
MIFMLGTALAQNRGFTQDERDDISGIDSDKFNSIINEVESLHQLVTKPREQAHCNEGITPFEYVACLVRDFGLEGGASIDSKKIGLVVPHVFKGILDAAQCSGP